MIKYQLICDQSHEFEGWFPSSTAYDEQKVGGLICCPHCGTLEVGRALMAPNVVSAKSRKGDASGHALAEAAQAAGQMAEQVAGRLADHTTGGESGAAGDVGPSDGPGQPAGPHSSPPGQPASRAAYFNQMITRMRAFQSSIESECRDVGDNFASEVRRMHNGEIESENIYGRATPEEREELDDEGIDVLKLPWLPRDN